MNSNHRLAACALPLLILAGCSAPTPEPTKPLPPAYTAKFQFAPPTVAAPGSAKVSIALVTYQNNDKDWNTFNSRFVTDLQGALVARGYSVKGPFATRDEMTYADKKGSDFVLTYSVVGSLDFDNVGLAAQPISKLSSLPDAEQARMWDGTYTNLPLVGSVKNIRGKAAYFKGEIKSLSKINLLLAESQSGEKLWTKTVDISIQPESFETVQLHGLPDGTSPKEALAKTTFWDQAMLNAHQRSLDAIYTNAFTAIWKHIDPEEMKAIKTQADEIKGKKVY